MCVNFLSREKSSISIGKKTKTERALSHHADKIKDIGIIEHKSKLPKRNIF
jgi:hypothetical protein